MTSRDRQIKRKQQFHFLSNKYTLKIWVKSMNTQWTTWTHYEQCEQMGKQMHQSKALYCQRWCVLIQVDILPLTALQQWHEFEIACSLVMLMLMTLLILLCHSSGNKPWSCEYTRLVDCYVSVFRMAGCRWYGCHVTLSPPCLRAVTVIKTAVSTTDHAIMFSASRSSMIKSCMWQSGWRQCSRKFDVRLKTMWWKVWCQAEDNVMESLMSGWRQCDGKFDVRLKTMWWKVWCQAEDNVMESLMSGWRQCDGKFDVRLKTMWWKVWCQTEDNVMERLMSDWRQRDGKFDVRLKTMWWKVWCQTEDNAMERLMSDWRQRDGKFDVRLKTMWWKVWCKTEDNVMESLISG